MRESDSLWLVGGQGSSSSGGCAYGSGRAARPTAESQGLPGDISQTDASPAPSSASKRPSRGPRSRGMSSTCQSGHFGLPWPHRRGISRRRSSSCRPTGWPCWSNLHWGQCTVPSSTGLAQSMAMSPSQIQGMNEGASKQGLLGSAQSTPPPPSTQLSEPQSWWLTRKPLEQRSTALPEQKVLSNRLVHRESGTFDSAHRAFEAPWLESTQVWLQSWVCHTYLTQSLLASSQ